MLPSALGQVLQMAQNREKPGQCFGGLFRKGRQVDHYLTLLVWSFLLSGGWGSRSCTPLCPGPGAQGPDLLPGQAGDSTPMGCVVPGPIPRSPGSRDVQGPPHLPHPTHQPPSTAVRLGRHGDTLKTKSARPDLNGRCYCFPAFSSRIKKETKTKTGFAVKLLEILLRCSASQPESYLVWRWRLCCSFSFQ